MCWIGFNKNRHIATEPTVVYKILLGYKDSEFAAQFNELPDYVSPFRKIHYELGVKYTAIPITTVPKTTKTTLEGDVYTSDGIHCFSAISCVRPRKESYKMFSKLETALHVTANKYAAYHTPHSFSFKAADGNYFPNSGKRILYVPVIIRCIIPEGTVYYKNKYGHITTESLILEKQLMTPEHDTVFKAMTQ